MGKENTSSGLVCHDLNDANKTTTEENKENSLKDKNSIHSEKLSRKNNKLNLKNSEVLEDENSNDSSSSTDTKISNTSTNNSSSTSTSKETSSSKTQKPESLITSTDKTSKAKKPESELKETEVQQEEPQFRVAPNNSTGFKLRIVPLEKLLEKPKESLHTKKEDKPSSPAASKKTEEKPDRIRRLPERSRKPTTFVEISESESDEDLNSQEGKGSESSDIKVKPVRRAAKSQANLRRSQQRPPSPSSIRKFVVKVKRSKLSDFKNLNLNSKKVNKNKMNGGTEKPSTSGARRRRDSSDDDSDFDLKQSDRVSAAEDEDDRDSSDSEVMPTRKRRVFQKGKNSNNSDDSDFDPDKKSKKKRRRIRQNSSDESDDGKKDKNKRKDIRKIIKTSELNISTKTATKEEEERRKRIEERQKLYNQIYEKPDSVEVTELVLDFDPETKSTLLEVDKGLMKKLKPHQVTGVKFMWDACFETIKDAQEKPGSGCILAHCMGLGKTMQIVTLSHTLLANSKKTNVERVLIISPLSTLNNWAREFKHWISFTRKKNIEIYDMSKYKDKNTRIFKLNEWFEEGGVCILGYDMYRILTNEKAKGLRKKQREQLQQSLVDPGPDLVVCDEGHLLKNEKTSISKAVTRMRTLRRIVLTGTPLQNNLKECKYILYAFRNTNTAIFFTSHLHRI